MILVRYASDSMNKGSSASQMTAAKVMDIISRHARLRRTSSRRSIQLIPKCKMEDAPTNIENSKVRMSKIFGYVYRSTIGQNHGPVWKTQSFLSKGICTVTLWKDYYGKGNLRRLGKVFKLGMFTCQPSKRTIPDQCVWTISKWQAKQKTWDRLVKFR